MKKYLGRTGNIADDNGLCESVNRAIEECISAGGVRATCVMANMPSCAEASSLRERFPDVSIGIHWNITQGRPVLRASEISSLIASDGLFHCASELRRRWLRRRLDVNQLRSELGAQYERLSEIGIRPDFWNTHENTHVYPGLFQMFVGIGRTLGLSTMRCHRRVTVPRGATSLTHSLTHPLYFLKGKVISCWSHRAEVQGVRMPDARLYTPGYDAAKASVEEVVKRVPWSKFTSAVEMIIHPAKKIEPEIFGNLTESRVLEFETFSDPSFIDRLRWHGVELVGFEILRRRTEN